MEPFSPVGFSGGEGGAANTSTRQVPASPEPALELPAYLSLERIPKEIIALHALWRQVPGFAVTKRKDGVAFTWNRRWSDSCPESGELIKKLQTAVLEEKWPWEWVMHTNQAATVNLDNLLHIYG